MRGFDRLTGRRKIREVIIVCVDVAGLVSGFNPYEGEDRVAVALILSKRETLLPNSNQKSTNGFCQQSSGDLVFCNI